MTPILLAIYRVRGPLFFAAAVILIGNLLLGRYLSAEGVREIRLALVLAALGVAVVCALLTFLVPARLADSPTRIVSSPVAGRWQGLNSPASAVPSHGLRAYGQAHAIDLVHEPLGTVRPSFGGRMMRASREYPAFGQPVFAMIDGTVVRASDWRRDHRARSNWWGFAYMMVEGMIREIGGPGSVIGNHVIIRGDNADGDKDNDGHVYAAVAHLQQGSATVRVGDRVTAGTRIGSCGNSGNSSEPHVHAQLMDRRSFWTAQGLPLAFAGITLGDGPEHVDGLPENLQHMTAAASSENPAA